MIFTQYAWLIETLGWTLLHSLWQGAAVAFTFFIVLRLMKTATANARYLTACAALCLFASLPAITFVRLARDFSTPDKIEKTILENQSNRAENAFPETPLSGSFEMKEPKNGNEDRAKNEPNAIQINLAWLEKQASPILPMLVWLWFLGVALTALRLSGGFWRLRELQRESIEAISSEWNKRFLRLTLELKINPMVRMLESSLVSTPLTIGWLKPLVIIPTSAFLHLAPHELETIIKHELIHIRRYDYLVNVIQSFVETAFFYHPGVWWISAVVRREREFACDDAVIQSSEDKFTYARALANLEQFRISANNKQSQLTLAASGGKLTERILRIVEPKSTFPASRTIPLAASFFLLFVTAVLISAFTRPSDFPVVAENKTKTKKMAIGFVSIPLVDRLRDAPKDSHATASLMITKLAQHKIPAIGFVLGGAVSDGENLFPARAEIVRMWRDAGLEIGIGSFKHIWFYDTPYDDYINSVEKNEKVTKQILAEKNLPLRYFSYPYLNTGKTAEDKEKFENWLTTRGLRSVKYTFDNQEWMYSYAYEAARKDGDSEKMQRIRAEFLDYMTKMLAHYEAYSQEMFGRDIAQTLVLTTSRLVADTSDELFGMFETRGYEFVSMDEAQKDAAYQTEEKFVNSKSGISWFERWQMAQGKKLRDEPRVDADVWKFWNEANRGK